MDKNIARREIVKGGLASLGLAALGLPLAEMQALAEDETLVPFLDFPQCKLPRFIETRR